MDNRWFIVAYLFITALTLYALTFVPADEVQARWLVVEGIFIPVGVILTVDAFTGRSRRRQLEVLLARQQARGLFLLLAGPRMLLLLLLGLGVGLQLGEGGILATAARTLLLLGVVHLVVNLSRSPWPALGLLALWWFMGLMLRTPWAEAPPVLAFWNPLLLAGGAQVQNGREVAAVAAGALLLVFAWFAAGRDQRWLD
jgi:hypothetical protein